MCIYVYMCMYTHIHVNMHAKLLPSCPTLCNPMECSPPGSSVHGIFQARILEWVAIPLSRGSSQPRDQTQVSCIQILYHLNQQGSPTDLPTGNSPNPLRTHSISNEFPFVVLLTARAVTSQGVELGWVGQERHLSTTGCYTMCLL